jgi:hypothetical protein
LVTIAQLPRPDMAKAGREILHLLQARQSAGPPEPVLDEYVAEIEPVVTALEQGIGGQELAASTLKALLARVEATDIDVDTWLRHHFYHVSVEASRRAGPNVARARALEEAAFPDGLSHVDHYIPDENRVCRNAVAALRSSEHASTAAAIGLQVAWTNGWEAALNASDAAFEEVQRARTGRAIHVLAGQDAEVAFVDVMVRLRKYVDSRAPRRDKVKVAQGRALLAPLLDRLDKARAEERARGTRKENAKREAGEGPSGTPGTEQSNG